MLVIEIQKNCIIYDKDMRVLRVAALVRQNLNVIDLWKADMFLAYFHGTIKINACDPIKLHLELVFFSPVFPHFV